MPVKMIDRVAGLFAYYFIFLAILSYEYMAQMKEVFGKSFIKVHHILARAGVLLMLIHPIAFAIEINDPYVFVPVFFPLDQFLIFAGRPAIFLFLIAVSTSTIRKRIPRYWKKVHYLNYVAFLLVFIHAWYIGTDIQSGIMQTTWFLMALVVTGIFVHKHTSLLKLR
ncbi:MAG: ferric reductase-like transmembrane domain-containing protein [Methanosarcinaceae archaeon]|nr:ferric reductase-like transmembrane domain-containing protein [Methanosarcinaceae archaeon]